MNNKIESTLHLGVSLHSQGTDNWALTKELALEVLEICRDCNYAVLGGDVYRKLSDHYKMSYDNWFSTKMAGESIADYISRSQLESKEYVENYQVGDGVFFVLVLSSGI